MMMQIHVSVLLLLFHFLVIGILIVHDDLLVITHFGVIARWRVCGNGGGGQVASSWRGEIWAWAVATCATTPIWLFHYRVFLLLNTLVFSATILKPYFDLISQTGQKYEQNDVSIFIVKLGRQWNWSFMKWNELQKKRWGLTCVSERDRDLASCFLSAPTT